MRRWLLALVAPALLLVALAPAASAAPPAATNAPLECFNQWANNPDYVGDGWVAARVAVTNGVFLGCGDERSGVVHIGHPDTTGTLHPIFAETQADFLRCFDRIASVGATRPDPGFPQTRTRYDYRYTYETIAGTAQGTASLIRDNAGGFVWTMFTSTGSEKNDWANCRGIPVR